MQNKIKNETKNISIIVEKDVLLKNIPVLGNTILTTPQGYLSNNESAQLQIGGELVCYIL